MPKKITKLIAYSLFFLFISSCTQEEKRILVFSKTEEFRHSSIEAGQIALIKMGLKHNFKVDTTEDASLFTEENLKQYSAVIFLNTTGNILDYAQQADFERYIQAGGGYVGIHAATDTEYDWKWYNELVGAYFNGHPKIQEAKLKILKKDHAATSKIDDHWIIKEEWYNFKNINPKIHVLIEIDEESYKGGTHKDKLHPMSWFHEFDGGRSFYTGMGHLDETFENILFLQHLLGGIKYAMGDKKLDYSAVHSPRVPEENRFVKEVLDFNLNEPMEMEETPNGILFIERRGKIKHYNFTDKVTKEIAQLDVFYGNEDGLIGLAVDLNFKNNNWIYLFYSAPGEISKQHISRFDLINDSLILDSEKLLLTIPTIRKCCHSGGSLEFGADGNLYIGVGDNTNPFESQGFAPIDERLNRALWDAQRSASNTNDLRGKILRITPQDDGTYTIPKGNLFPKGTEKTRPEIYAMGLRNPFRFSIDSQNGNLYWGDVGPDSGKEDSLRGPAGMGEFNQARKAGYWGWPYTRGNNQLYNDYNFTTEESGEKFDPKNIINDSPNNTGLKKLPLIQPSLIWYSYDKINEFPWLGKGGVNPMAGPVFHTADFPNSKEGFPDYFENKLFIYEWMRDWIYIVTLDENQNYSHAESFMPNSEFSHPMDMFFGTDGKMYVLEYGQKWNVRNIDARLCRINYIKGNRPPLAKIDSDKEVGALPLTIQFSAKESKDYDNDNLTYEWFFTKKEVQSTEMNPVFTFDKIGIYNVKLKVTDASGLSVTSNKKILVGNDPPQLNIEIDSKDMTYWKNKKVNYKVVVKDREDGSSENQTIDASRIKVTLNYLAEGEDLIIATLGHQQNSIPKGKLLIDNSDCKACHAIKEKVNGPSYIDIAAKYNNDDIDYLVGSVIKGSAGTWGETMMSAHPQLKIEEVQEMIKYILSNNPTLKSNEKNLATSGTLEFKEQLKSEEEGKYILMASYLDSGNPKLKNSALSVRDQIVFKGPKIQAEDADERTDGLGDWNNDGSTLVGSIVHNSFLKFENQSFKNLNSIKLAAKYNPDYNYQGKVEIREKSTTGKIIGEMELGYFDKEKIGTKIYQIPVKPNINIGDLFLVFKNPKDEKQFILNADWILLNR
ncbi:ThuA domain-containing protein [bacterium]|nr:ThuA domain-containing protein [bacterium]MDB4539285.1 ThuA domain-containing protein [Saprospiraceae bacterium]